MKMFSPVSGLDSSKILNSMGNITLQTPRLFLRNISLDDVDLIVKYAGELEVAEMMNGSIPHPYTPDLASQWVKKHINDSPSSSAISWAIVDGSSQKLIGAIQLRLDDSRTSARLSYWLGRPFWGQGFTTEAVKKIVEFAKIVLKLSYLTAEYFERNGASGKVLEKVEFQRCGQRPHVEKLQNKQEQMIEYRLDL